MSSLLIQNGRVIDPAQGFDETTDILVTNGKIQRIGKKLNASGAETIDATGKIVTPGLIDLQVHFREPGFASKETIETGMRAALKGGVTSVVTMPNTSPVTDSAEVIALQKNRAEALKLINLYPAGAITRGQLGTELANMGAMKASGARAFTDDGKDVQDAGLLKKAMLYAKTLGLPIMSHCQVEALSGDGVMHEGAVSAELGLAGISASTEDLAVLKNLVLAEETGAQLHILHVSTKNAVEFIALFQKRGVRVTAETCPQYFCLTDELCRGYNTNAKMYPPLRSEEHRRAIQEGLKKGVLSVISTDHAPHTPREKMMPFPEAAWGSTGLETSFALGYTHLVQEKVLSLPEFIATMTLHPARVIDIPKGTLAPGADADIAIFDLESKWTIRAEEMATKGRNCVFEGMRVHGSAETVIVGGEIKMEQRKVR